MSNIPTHLPPTPSSAAAPTVFPVPSDPTTMDTASTSGDPAAAGEPTPSPSAPDQPRPSTSRISHIVRTYLGLSSTSKKRRAASRNQPKAGAAQETPAAGDGREGGRPGSPSAQPSRLLRELGVRVSRYTHEERRDIILRYMQKRSGRRSVDRTATKVPSRQALAERRRRGAGGKFLGKEDVQVQPGASGFSRMDRGAARFGIGHFR